MSRRQNLIIAIAACLTSSALIIPASGLQAQSWTTVTHNHMPIIDGSGRVVQQNRPVPSFQRVETVGSESVDVRFGPRPALVIIADDNILPLITTEVRGGTLKIGTRGSFRTRNTIRVQLTTPSLQGLKTFGSGDVRIHGANNERLELAIHGSSDLRATGRVSQLDVNVFGSGTARLEGLSAGAVDASVYGSGEAIVRASGDLEARVFGSGTVRYVGQPANIRRQNLGSGRIVAAR